LYKDELYYSIFQSNNQFCNTNIRQRNIEGLVY